MAGPRGPRLKGQALVDKLNDVVAQPIRDNRRLKRQVDALTQRGTSVASGTVDRSLRTIKRRVQKALTLQLSVAVAGLLRSPRSSAARARPRRVPNGIWIGPGEPDIHWNYRAAARHAAACLRSVLRPYPGLGVQGTWMAVDFRPMLEPSSTSLDPHSCVASSGVNLGPP
jgi:hypothetical protein